MIVKNRIEQQRREALALKEMGYIIDFRIYQDVNNLRFRLEKVSMPEDLFADVEMFLIMLEMPILIDKIEELVTNFQREKIRKDLHTLDLESKKQHPENKDLHTDYFRFYESNKLQSSNIMGVISLTKMCHHSIILPKEIMDFWEKLRHEFNGMPRYKFPLFIQKIWEKIRKYFKYPDYSEYQTNRRYKGRLNNKQKIVVVEYSTKLLEMVLKEILKRYEV